jgi:Holliday junction DNA helicase RuvB
MSFHLDYYPADDLVHIVRRSARILAIDVDDEAAWEIARRSRGTPRIANRLLRRVRDFAQVERKSGIDNEITRYALTQLDVDALGLDEMDKKVLSVIIERFGGGPVGLGSLAVAVGEDAGTLEEVYEPFLVQQGMIQRTPRGRVAQQLAYEHLGVRVRRDARPQLDLE